MQASAQHRREASWKLRHSPFQRLGLSHGLGIRLGTQSVVLHCAKSDAVPSPAAQEKQNAQAGHLAPPLDDGHDGVGIGTAR